MTASSLYLSREMTTEQLARVLAALQRIHAATASPSGIGGMCSSGMYANYAAKLEARYASHDYSVFEGARACMRRCGSNCARTKKRTAACWP